MSELLPCPFCGEKAESHGASEPWEPGGMHTNGPNHLRVGCRNCLLFFCEEDQRDVPHLQRRERCITRWNTRAPHPAVEVLDAIESKLQALADDQQFSVAYLRGWIEEARKAKNV